MVDYGVNDEGKGVDLGDELEVWLTGFGDRFDRIFKGEVVKDSDLYKWTTYRDVLCFHFA